MQGIQYMADTLTAAISEPLNNFMGDTTAKPATIFDPRLNQGRGGYVVAGADVYGGVQRDAYGRIIGGTAGAGIENLIRMVLMDNMKLVVCKGRLLEMLSDREVEEVL